MIDNFKLDLKDEDGNIIKADEDGSVNLLPYIHQKLTMSITVTPVHALRMIKIELPCKPFASFNRKEAYNSKIRTSKTSYAYYFKTEYDRIGRGKKYMERKHA